MNANSMTVRAKVAIELGIITVLTIAFLLLFPRRNPWLDVGLAGFALACIGASAGYTRKVVWAASPLQPGPNRFRKSVRITLWVTVPTVVGFLLVGAVLGYRNGGWPAVTERILNWKILAVFGAYIAWAFMQQTLFQFYLLGRLLTLFPRNQSIWPVLITGLGFSLVHLPDVWTSLVTAVAGWCGHLFIIGTAVCCRWPSRMQRWALLFTTASAATIWRRNGKRPSTA